MAEFIQLTSAINDKPIWIRSSAIKAISITDTYSIVWVSSAIEEYFCIKETPQEIIQLVEMEV